MARAVEVLQRRGIVVAAITTIVLATLSQVGIVLTGVGWGYLYYGSASRATSFAMGILLASGADRLPKLRWLPFPVSCRWDWRMGFRSGPA